MAGVTLSRWTMSYFALALASFLAAQCLMAAGYGFPGALVQAPQTLVLVHIVAIGWLSLLMCGALFQFVPVLVAKPLYSNFLPLPALVCLVAGLVALLLGFLQLAGTFVSGPEFLVVGAVLLGIGFAMALWNLGCTLWSGRPLGLPARFVVGGLCGLAAAAGLGLVFAFVLGGATAEMHLVALTSAGLPLHVVLGLGAWLTFTAIGVSYRLLAMFMLAPDLDRPSTRIALYLGTIAIAIVIIGVAAAAFDGNPVLFLAAAGVLTLAAAVAFGADAVHLYRARKRPKIELNSRMAALALISLAASVALIIVLVAFGQLVERIGAVVFLTGFGWLSGLGLAQLYKIIAFLTWLECYGPVLGKAQTPRVQDLVTEAHAFKWFVLYFSAVWTGTLTLLLGYGQAFRITAAVMVIATAGIVAHMVRTRRLSDVNPNLRLPEGARRPRLLLALSRQT